MTGDRVQYSGWCRGGGWWMVVLFCYQKATNGIYMALNCTFTGYEFLLRSSRITRLIRFQCMSVGLALLHSTPVQLIRCGSSSSASPRRISGIHSQQQQQQRKTGNRIDPQWSIIRCSLLTFFLCTRSGSPPPLLHDKVDDEDGDNGEAVISQPVIDKHVFMGE